jgi:hypothetical protein
MKKHSPSNGQNKKLMHWWLLVHFGHNKVMGIADAFIKGTIGQVIQPSTS